MNKDIYFDSPMFFPWIGNEYNNGGIFNKKILLLGEAHYCWSIKDCEGCLPGNRNDCNMMTINTIKDQMSENKKKHAIFTKLVKLFLDKEIIDLNDKTVFWNSVACYNYIQPSVSDRARVAPTSEMCSISVKPFYEVMDKLEPDFLLVISSRLWENLPGQEGIDWPAGPTVNENNIIEKTWYYKGKRKNTLSLVIYHPSTSYFSYSYSPVVKKSLSLS